eukprot:jgi/Hompol1/447/HPOL_004194-RA
MFFELMYRLRRPIFEIAMWLAVATYAWDIRFLRREIVEACETHRVKVKALKLEIDAKRSSLAGTGESIVASVGTSGGSGSGSGSGITGSVTSGSVSKRREIDSGSDKYSIINKSDDDDDDQGFNGLY